MLFLLSIVNTLFAQDRRQRLKEYRKAKKYYTASEYGRAKEAFKELSDLERKDAFTPYALFYYGLAAYHSEEKRLAEKTFLQVNQTFQDWDRREEVLYWLGQLAFEKEDYITALDYLASITQKSFEDSVQKMKWHFLRQINNTILLLELLELHPHDRVIAEVLAYQIVQQPVAKQDHVLLEFLVSEFKLAKQKYDFLSNISTKTKNSYNVAVLFPFFVDELSSEEENDSNPFVIALYEGIKIAVEVLKEEGITINLYAYDTKKDSSTTVALLAQDEIKEMDLIIGPLYASTIPLVSSFSKQYQINLFNPLSSNMEVVGDNPFSFLVKSSLETKAKKAAAFTTKSMEDMKVGIVYGTSREDSIRAHTYKQHIERDAANDAVLMLRIEPTEAQWFLSTFREIDDDQSNAYKLDSLTHIYVASNDELIVANVLSAVEMLNLDVCLIGDEKWLTLKSITFEQLQRLKVLLTACNYIDYNKQPVHEFRVAFHHKFFKYPTYYTYTGYDMMLFLGRMLYKYGVYFQQHWGGKLYEGEIFPGFVYGKFHDNQHVLFVKFQNEELVVCDEIMSH